MNKHVCPWWVGYFLASPLRKLFVDPYKLLGPFLKKGMTAVDVGPGMGFFTIPMARLIGPEGRVIAVDVQRKMLEKLTSRAGGLKGIAPIETKLCFSVSLGLEEYAGKVDFALAFAVIHEVPDVESLFKQIRGMLKKGSTLFIAEPKGHVSPSEFLATLDAAQSNGFIVTDRPPLRRHFTALLKAE